MEDDLKNEMGLLFKAFFPDCAERWEYLLARNPERWDKMRFYRFAIGEQIGLHGEDVLAHPMIARHLDRTVVALECRGRNNWIKHLPLREAYHEVFEGLISIVPGKLGLLLNHNGECWLLQK